jgi:3-deoxy-manno-octulosonate cytidylyltransferase (CMP-KDO synthetase)
MKILGVIPARFASTRFPGKPLAMIGQKPMIQHVWDRCVLSQHVKDWVVATDDQRIFDSVKSFGGRAMMTSQNAQSGTDRCAEVLQAFPHAFDVVINVQGDEPLVDVTQIDALALAMKHESSDIATLVKWNNNVEDYHNANRVKCARSIKGHALYFSRSPIPHFQKTTDFTGFFKHLGMYAYTAQFLHNLHQLQSSPLEQAESLEQLRWLDNGYQILTIETQIETPSVDTPEDLELILSQFL